MSKAVVLGSLNMDLSISCEQIPAAGETINGNDFLTNPGGKGANQAVAASRLGADVYLIGAVGNDEFGSLLINTMKNAGINCDELYQLEDVPTGNAIIIREGSENRIILNPGANHKLETEEVCQAIDEIGEPGDIFLTQFECDFETTKNALKHAHDKGLFCMVNPAPAREIPEDMWESLDFICVNETECELLTGIYPKDLAEAAQAAKIFVEKGVSEIVITLGSQGAFGRQNDEEYFIPPVKVDAVDTTAAGDTFIGSMIAAQAEGKSFEEAMRFAAMASALTVSRKGAQQSIPTSEEVSVFEENLNS